MDRPRPPAASPTGHCPSPRPAHTPPPQPAGRLRASPLPTAAFLALSVRHGRSPPTTPSFRRSPSLTTINPASLSSLFPQTPPKADSQLAASLPGVPWPPRAPCRHVPTISAPCALRAHNPPFIQTWCTQLEAHPRQCDLILTSTIFPNKGTF